MWETLTVIGPLWARLYCRSAKATTACIAATAAACAPGRSSMPRTSQHVPGSGSGVAVGSGVGSGVGSSVGSSVGSAASGTSTSSSIGTVTSTELLS